MGVSDGQQYFNGRSGRHEGGPDDRPKALGSGPISWARTPLQTRALHLPSW
jgi:hypothetical protein